MKATPFEVPVCVEEAAWIREQRITAPTGVANFPKDILAFPQRSLVERGYNAVHWTDMPKGGHFASLEEPELLLADVRAFVAGL